jgi:Pentapeptide repeats (8 copies)
LTRSGAPGGIRTPGLLVRSQTLYPAELRAHPWQLHYFHTATQLRQVHASAKLWSIWSNMQVHRTQPRLFPPHGSRCSSFSSMREKASLRGAELAFSYAAGANFRGADLRGCSLIEQKLVWADGIPPQLLQIPSLMRPATSEIKVFGERRLL